jgi:hypothetical protein
MRIESRNSRLRRFVVRCALIAVVLTSGPTARQACAYLTFGDLFGFDDYFPNKWGDTVVGTTPVDPITWGFMTDGAGVDPNFRIDPFSYPDTSGVVGTSRIGDLRTSFDQQYGNGTFVSAFQRAFNTWSAAAHINFQFVETDSGLPVNNPGSTSPQIRIGAFSPDPNHSFRFSSAVGFAPPPNGGTLEGDIILNFAAGFQIAPGTEDVTPINFFFGNDLESLALHEIGHALGLAHPDPNDPLTLPDDVMLIHTDGSPYLVNRQLSADDLAGIRHIYGLRSRLLGDFNLDGSLTPGDIQAMLLALVNLADFQWRKGVSNADLLAIGDLNSDNKVTNGDIQSLLNLLASGEGSVAAVSEPGSGALLLAGLMLVGGVRRRGRMLVSIIGK